MKSLKDIVGAACSIPRLSLWEGGRRKGEGEREDGGGRCTKGREERGGGVLGGGWTKEGGGGRGGEERYLDCFQASSETKLAFSDCSVVYCITSS